MRINTLSSGLGAAARGTAGRQSQLLLLVSGEGDGRPGETVLSKAMSEAQKASRTVLSRLDEVRSAASEQRKAAAQQKLELARKKLQMLRMLSGDPKTVARQAKQIAQEIREADKEYGAAAARPLERRMPALRPGRGLPKPRPRPRPRRARPAK